MALNPLPGFPASVAASLKCELGFPEIGTSCFAVLGYRSMLMVFGGILGEKSPNLKNALPRSTSDAGQTPMVLLQAPCSLRGKT